MLPVNFLHQVFLAYYLTTLNDFSCSAYMSHIMKQSVSILSEIPWLACHFSPAQDVRTWPAWKCFINQEITRSPFPFSASEFHLGMLRQLQALSSFKITA
ncbi:UNVERIFIED_CONTAM: hypothetical protein K2H54_018222 [Gekko kuhli]